MHGQFHQGFSRIDLLSYGPRSTAARVVGNKVLGAKKDSQLESAESESEL